MHPVSLVDTDIVSSFVKKDSRCERFATLLQGHRQAISFMTAAELFQWGFKRKWGPKRMAWLEEHIQSYAILPPDQDTCRKWAQIRISCERVGRQIALQDAWIAATALCYDIPLVTHNHRDYKHIEGLKLQIPQDEEPPT